MTGVWGWWVLGRNSGWLPALRWTVLAVSVVATIPLLASLISRTGHRVLTAAFAVGVLGELASPTAYTVATLGQAHHGGNPLVGPVSNSQAQGPGPGSFEQREDDPELTAMLRATHTEWSGAVSRSSSAANLELASDTAVMAIGGFTGSDPTPSLNEFIDDVHNGLITYYVVQKSRQFGPGHNGQSHRDITDWVAANFRPVKVGPTTVYNLTSTS
jgi:hypothetical protein